MARSNPPAADKAHGLLQPHASALPGYGFKDFLWEEVERALGDCNLIA